MKVARAKLREIGPDDVDMAEYKVREQRAALVRHRPKRCVGSGECGAEQTQQSLARLPAASLPSEVRARRRTRKGAGGPLGASCAVGSISAADRIDCCRS